MYERQNHPLHFSTHGEVSSEVGVKRYVEKKRWNEKTSVLSVSAKRNNTVLLRTELRATTSIPPVRKTIQ